MASTSKTRGRVQKALPISLSTSSVIDAAVQIVDAEGESSLGFNRVARELGIKPPSLYNHIADLEDLRRRVAIRGWERYANACELVTKRRRGASALRALAYAYLEMKEQWPGIFIVMATTRLLPTDIDFKPVAQRIVSCFKSPLRQLRVTEDQFWHVLRTFRAAIHGFVWLEMQGQFAANEKVHESFEQMLSLLIRGISKDDTT